MKTSDLKVGDRVTFTKSPIIDMLGNTDIVIDRVYQVDSIRGEMVYFQDTVLRGENGVVYSMTDIEQVLDYRII